MALQESGSIYLSEIQSELGGANPVYMNEYYRGGSIVGTGPNYTNYSSGLSGSYAPNVPSSGSVYMNNYYGTEQVKSWNQNNTPCHTGIGYDNQTRYNSISLSSIISGLSTGDTFYLSAELDTRCSWYHSNNKNIIIACTVGQSASAWGPNYYDKDHNPYIAYDGGNTVTVGVRYLYKSTGGTTLGAYLQGVSRR